jgi:hypothetical protein
MRTPLFAALLAGALLVLAPCDLPAPAQNASISSATASGPIELSDQDLQQLVAPVALYPDPLLALILQASTVPSDVVLANRWLNNDGAPDDIDSQPWDDSVKGLAHYPDVLQMMDDNLDWTNQLGAAVLAQQADVMRAVQVMRAKAQALGNLETTSEQQVITQGNVIEIVPANPQVIYVPTYEPTVIYYQSAPPIIFGNGFAIGIWLGGGCNWNNYYFYRSGFYRPGHGWGYRPGGGVIWRPPPGRPPPRPPYRPGKPGNLPGWRPPPNGGRPPGGGRPQPGTPSRPPGSKPRPPTDGPGNRPERPNRPGQPANPGKPGNRPGNGGGPSIQPVKPPGNQNPNKPGTRPTQPPSTRPNRPENPSGPSIKPVRPPPSRPSNPSPKPQPRQDFNQNRPSSKPRPAPQPSRPTAQPRPAQGGGGGGPRTQ